MVFCACVMCTVKDMKKQTLKNKRHASSDNIACTEVARLLQKILLRLS